MADGSITISITGDAKELEAELKKVNERIKQTGKNSEESGKQGSKLGSMISAGCKVAAAALATVGTAAGGAAVAAYKVGSEYETALAKVGTIADTAAKPLATLSDEIMELSSKTGIAASDIAEATYSAISATGDTANAVSIVAQATQLATAGFASTGDSLNTLTGIMNAYGMQAQDLERVSDSLIATQNLGVLTIGELSSSMGRAISTASAYNVGLSNLETGYISLTKAGISCDESTTYLSSMFSELGDAGSNVGKILTEETGQSFGQLMESGYSLADVLQILYDSCGQDSEALMQLWGSQEAGKASNAIVSQGLQQFNDWLGQVEDSAGTTASAYEQMQATVSAQTDILKNNIKNLGIQLYDSFSPALVGAIEQINTALSSDQMSAAIDSLGQSLSSAATAAGGLISSVLPSLIDGLTWVLNHASEVAAGITAIGTALTVIRIGTGIASAVDKIKELGGVAAGIGSAIATIGGPVTLVVAGIAALAAGIVVLWNTNEGFRNAVTGIWSAITGVISGAVTGICNFFTQTIPAALTSLTSFFSTAWSSITAAASTAWNTICNVVQTAILLIAEIISAAVQIITIPFQFIWQNCQTVVTTAWEGIKAAVSAALSAISGVISSVWSGIASVISSILAGISGTVSSIWNAISSVISSVLNTIRSVVSSVLNGVRSTVSSIMNGIKSTFSNVWNSIKTTVSNAINNVKSTISSGLNTAKSTVSNVLGSIKSKFSDIWSKCTDTVSKAISKIKSAMHFSWSLPKLKLPHISISGKFSLNPPSAPHFSISWYKRAMKGAMLLDGATIFGMSGNSLLGGGESGHEYIVGQNLLKRDIEDSVTAALQNARLSLVADTRTAAANASTAYTTNHVYFNGSGANNITYNQTINSPKAMSRREVRRETKNTVKELKSYA